MRIEQLMSRQVRSCGPEDTLDTAARAMWDHDCGALPVCGEDGSSRLVGIITDRDICMSALFQGKPLHELRVSEAMSREVRVCQPGDSPAEVEQMMRSERIRRVPVADDEGNVIGIVSLADLAREAERQQSSSTQEITETEVGDTLAAIVEPGGRQPGAQPAA